MVLDELAKRIEAAEPTAHCQINKMDFQIIVSFDKRQDVEIALLTPYAKKQVLNGCIDNDLYSDLLFSVKRIANYAI